MTDADNHIAQESAPAPNAQPDIQIPAADESYTPTVLPDGQSSKRGLAVFDEIKESSSASVSNGLGAAVHKAQSGSDGSRASVIAAFIGNLAVGVVKFIAAAISGSSAMLSEGMHSMVDSTDSLLLMLGLHRSQKAPDLEHPFGYSHELYFWSLVVAVMVFALGGGLSLYEGFSHIRAVTPDTVMGDPTLNYIVIAAAAVIEGISLSVALRNFNKARGAMRPFQFIRETKDPSLFTVVLEDSAAELGLFFAFMGVFLGHLFGNPYLDGAASLCIGVLLCGVAGVLLRETKGLLIGEGLRASELREVEHIIEGSELVAECGRILSLYMGPNDLLLTADVTFKHGVTADQIMAATDQIEARIVQRFPQTTRIFIESESLRYTRSQSIAASSVGASDPLPVDTTSPSNLG